MTSRIIDEKPQGEPKRADAPSVARPDQNICTLQLHDQDLDLLEDEVIKSASPRPRIGPPLSSRMAEPHDFWDEIRSSGTIPLNRANGDVYLPTRYADVKLITERPAIFSSRQIVVGPNADEFTSCFPPFTSDHPIHGAQRGTLAPLFSAKHTAKFRDVANYNVGNTIDLLLNRPTCDVVSEFALPFVISVIGSLIGISSSEMGVFRNEALAFFETRENNRDRAIKAALIDRRFRRLLARREDSPDDDIASALLAARQDGQPIEAGLPATYLSMLIEAGVETTAGVISFALKHLANPVNRKALNVPAFSWKRAVEEFLRLASPAMLARRSMSTSLVNGCPIAKDSAVLLSFAAANRDPDVFSGPHEVDLDRRRNRHLAFGSGVHRCLGMHLARILIETGVKRWVTTFPAYEIDCDGEITWSSGSIRALTRLRVVVNKDATEPEQDHGHDGIGLGVPASVDLCEPT